MTTSCAIAALRLIGNRTAPVAYVMDRGGIGTRRTRCAPLVGASEKLKPFPDVVAAIAQLRAKGYGAWQLYRYRRQFAETASRPPGRTSRCVDHVSRSRRPAVFQAAMEKPYDKAARSSGRTPPAFSSVDNHAFDCLGAKSYGMRTAFIDRRKRPFGQPRITRSGVADFAIAAVMA